MRTILLALLMIFTMQVGVAQAASFDCAKAVTKTEKAICADSELSNLDELMAHLYKQTLRSNDWEYFEEEEDTKLIAKQRAAISQQVTCGSNDACLTEFYYSRINILLDDLFFSSEEYTGSRIDGLIRFINKIEISSDIRNISSNYSGSIVALLVSSGDPSNIDRSANGTVQNDNPVEILIEFTDSNNKKAFQTLVGPSGTTAGVSLNIGSDDINIYEEHTRGHSSTSYGLLDGSWKLTKSEYTGVTSPAAGLYYETTVDHINKVNFGVVGYIYASCSVRLPPTFNGDSDFWHFEQIEGYQDYLDPNWNERVLKQMHVDFMNKLTDRDLYGYSVWGFEAGNFEIAVKGLDILNQRVQTSYQDRLSKGYRENDYPELIKSAFDCVSSTAEASLNNSNQRRTLEHLLIRSNASMLGSCHYQKKWLGTYRALGERRKQTQLIDQIVRQVIAG